jgi:hypothetical protein
MVADYLTKQPGMPNKADAVPGMAHFRGSGPSDTTCRTCMFHRYMRDDLPKLYGGCQKYFALTGRHGPTVSGTNASCKYYEEARR